MSLKFIDLFAGLGGFHKALASFNFECVFASEIDEELRENYKKNFPLSAQLTYGDIRECKYLIPKHDILCGGFPCQPFSKSGFQRGLEDETEGTLFHEILDVLEQHRPTYVFLENVGNFERHDSGRTWSVVKDKLKKLGYTVHGTTHVASGGPGLLSPHHLGFPHCRERFYIVGYLGKLSGATFPSKNIDPLIPLRKYLQTKKELSSKDKQETCLSNKQRECIEHWNQVIKQMPENLVPLPSFPIWSDEFEATYPFSDYTPYAATINELRQCLSAHPLKKRMKKDELLDLLPSYARTPELKFPAWKIKLIRQNLEWFNDFSDFFIREWLDTLKAFPPSLRKLEWNCHGEERDLWKHVLQFRPSGLRVKRFSSIPALVAMTETQIPILGPKQRFISRMEGLRLLGFPDNHILPETRERAFKALGNGVHVEVVKAIVEQVLSITAVNLYKKQKSSNNSRPSTYDEVTQDQTIRQFRRTHISSVETTSEGGIKILAS
jgi:DNA (cytosine-5)-methyltransferase 1